MSAHHKLLTLANPLIQIFIRIGINIGILEPNQLRILIFHDIPPNQEKIFHNQLVWLQKKWTIVTPEIFEKMISGTEAIKGNNLLITFDDGLISNRIVAEKFLNPMGIKFIFFVVSDFVNIEDKEEAHQFISKHIMPDANVEDIPNNWNNMKWSDLKALLEQGHSIGGHTKRHARLSACNNEHELKIELIESADCITKKLGCEVKHFAFTFGDIDSFSKEALSIARRKYSYIYAGARGNNARSLSRHTIRRDCAAIQSEHYEYIMYNNNLLDAFLGGAADIFYRKYRKLIDSWL
jgi:peptidoglycan/xylan/chitin deacetylase (PgdA/CDA1 family)